VIGHPRRYLNNKLEQGERGVEIKGDARRRHSEREEMYLGRAVFQESRRG